MMNKSLNLFVLKSFIAAYSISLTIKVVKGYNFFSSTQPL